MALTSGTRFGSYEITGEIGAGGMGEVYRARDTQLERDVAVKVLPESFAADVDRVARFEQEAKLLAALNHPNIAQIYGLERSSGVLALIMELVEGPTLEEPITAGPLAIDEALGCALQIVVALEAAHGQGIVHRDLKPANIKLRPDGTVKVLDFGVAKALGGPGQQSGPRSPSLTTPAMTEAGTILGTAAYMAPEQARGRPVDQRADIWAFGCVLYEMLTGQPAFGGEDVTTTLARVLERDVDMKALPASTPPHIRQALRLCLAKEPGKRLHAIGDVRLGLTGAFDAGVPAEGSVSPRAPLWRRALPIAAAVVITALVIGLGKDWLGADADTAPARRGLTRFNHLLPDYGRFQDAWGRTLGISPDGTYFVYIYDEGLLLRRMDEIEPELLVSGSPIFLACRSSLPIARRSPFGIARRTSSGA